MNITHGIEFEHLGYFVEYMQGDKYIGSINLDKPDRDQIGYYSRQDHVATQDIIFKNKRIRKGESYHTRLYPLCGRSNFNPKNLKVLWNLQMNSNQ